jgi:hypothetical protein
MESFAGGLGGCLEEDQIVFRRYNRCVSQVRGKRGKTGLHVGTGAVPAQECVDGEGEAEVVYAWSPASSRPNARCPNHLS